MTIKRIHFISGLLISIFVGMHLLNHLSSILGVEKHIEMMNKLRFIYRNVIVESILMLAVLVQIVSGLKLFSSARKTASSLFDKLHIWTGLYLAAFFIIHVSAIFVGRLILQLDTNFYFGVAGLNSFPANLFFIPYYALAILSFFGHIAAIHHKKINTDIFGLSPQQQAKVILFAGLVITICILYGLTNQFKGVTIPTAYDILVGK